MAEAALMSDLAADERHALAETLEECAALRNMASTKVFALPFGRKRPVRLRVRVLLLRTRGSCRLQDRD